MKNSLKEIYQWQVDSGNAIRPQNDFLEDSFTIEESIEGYSNLHMLAATMNVDHTLPKLPKEISRAIVKVAQGSDSSPLSKLERLDKACDKIVFAIGDMAKLGLNAQEINEALNIVNNANKAKLGCPRDEHGKLMKPADFDEKYAPEPKLSALLDKVEQKQLKAS